MGLNLKLVPKASLKLQSITTLAASLSGSGPVTAVKANGNYTVGLDYSKLSALDSTEVTDKTTIQYLAYDVIQKTFKTITLANTFSAIGSDDDPLMDGTADAGSAIVFSRGDHVHPTDTTRSPVASPAFTGVPVAPTATADTNTTQLATTAYVVGQAATATPLMDGTAAVGTSLKYAREDHKHPSDTTKVTGPASATDGNIAVFDGTTGKLVKDGGALASQAEAEAGTATNRFMSPQRVRDYLETGSSFLQAGTGAVARPYLTKAREWKTVDDYWTGTSDWTAAFNDALAANDVVYVLAGSYNVDDIIRMGRDRNVLIGSSQQTTTLMGTSTTQPIIQPAGGTYLEIANLLLDRNVTATSTAHGIQQEAAVGTARLRGLFVTNQWFGIVLTSVFAGVLEYSTSTANKADGILIAGANNQPTQWQLKTIGVGNNDGNGILVKSFDNTSVTLGEPWTDITSFANSGNGIRLQGSSGYSVNDFMVRGGFMGSDAGSEIYLDTYAGGGGVCPLISDIQMENTGNSSTGSTTTTAATNAGSGIEVTANNPAVNITGMSMNGMAENGIKSAAALTNINGATITNVGQAGGSEANGVYITAGSAIITNVSSGNDGGTTQKNGIVLDTSSTKNIVVGNNVGYKSGNATAGIVDNSSTPLTNTILGNTGHTNQLIASLRVGGDVTLKPSTTSNPVNIGDLTIESSSDTTLTFKKKAADGTIKTGSITLA